MQESQDLHKNRYTKSRKLISRHVKNSSGQRTEQLKRKLSHLGQIVVVKKVNSF